MEDKKKYWESSLWKELQTCDPVKVCERCKVTFEDSRYYSVKSLNSLIKVYPEERCFESDDRELAGDPDFQLLVVSYLLYAQKIDIIGKWISEKDLKGGSLFFRGPHCLPSSALEKEFGTSRETFAGKSLRLGGKPLDFGDISMCFPVLPLIPLTVVLWLKDEEFPARVTFMMDQSIEAHLPLDVICAMAASVTKKLLTI